MKKFVLCAIVLTIATGCASSGKDKSMQLNADAEVGRENIDKLFVVDCLLPGQVRSLGESASFNTARRPIKTSALDCEVRGGEYVAFDRADYATALKIWLPQAQAGDPNAQTIVGEIYEKGMGIVPDYEVAALWYKKAANQNYSRAQINLGYLYEKGLGVEQDLTQSMNLYRKASGLPDEIAYVSEVALSAQREELQSLKDEVKRLQTEAEGYRKQLNGAQQKLKAAQTDESSTQKDVARLQKQIEQLQKAPKKPDAKDAATQTADTQAQVTELLGQLKLRQDELTNQGILIARLAKEAADYRGRISIVEKQRLAINGPSIEILDPPLAATRGKPNMLFRTASQTREIYGKVIAPAGVKFFSFNDRKIFLRPDNSFRIPIESKESSSQVKLQAVDGNDRKANLEFVVTLAQDTQLKVSTEKQPTLTSQIQGINVGSYHALIIGNNQYKHLPNLKTAVNDATEADTVLRTKFGFTTTLLLNADRYQILSALHKLKQTLGGNTNLLVYFAGHGDLDKINDRGYWLPIDAEVDNTANWISNEAITDILNTLPSKHIMVVADSCYSGTMTRTSVPRIEDALSSEVKKKWIELMAKSRSRTVLSSGGLQPVLDEGGGNHSIFANAFLSALKNSSDLLQGYALYRHVANEVSLGSGSAQTPEYAPIRRAGHETGQFFFVPKT